MPQKRGREKDILPISPYKSCSSLKKGSPLRRFIHPIRHSRENILKNQDEFSQAFSLSGRGPLFLNLRNFLLSFQHFLLPFVDSKNGSLLGHAFRENWNRFPPKYQRSGFRDGIHVKLPAHRAGLPGHVVASRMRANETSFLIVPLDPLGFSNPPISRGLRDTCRSISIKSAAGGRTSNLYQGNTYP